MKNLPFYIWEYAPGKIFYGFRDLGGGIKVARHHQGMVVDPDNCYTIVHQGEIDGMTETLRRYLNLNPAFTRAETCLYRTTPDEKFIIDRHPEDERTIVAILRSAMD